MHEFFSHVNTIACLYRLSFLTATCITALWHERYNYDFIILITSMNSTDQFRAFHRFYSSLVLFIESSIDTDGFTLNEIRVLLEVQGLQPCSARQILQGVKVDKGALSRIIYRLRDKELLHVSSDAPSWKGLLISLTDQGHQQAQRLLQAYDEQFRKILSNMPARKEEELTAAMDVVRGILGDYYSTAVMKYRGSGK
ncbi:MAG: MarR family winged helix-turn-helix transcriptional regulator [Chitinophagaceae bacterium]